MFSSLFIKNRSFTAAQERYALHVLASLFLFLCMNIPSFADYDRCKNFSLAIMQNDYRILMEVDAVPDLLLVDCKSSILKEGNSKNNLVQFGYAISLLYNNKANFETVKESVRILQTLSMSHFQPASFQLLRLMDPTFDYGSQRRIRLRYGMKFNITQAQLVDRVAYGKSINFKKLILRAILLTPIPEKADVASKILKEFEVRRMNSYDMYVSILGIMEKSIDVGELKNGLIRSSENGSIESGIQFVKLIALPVSEEVYGDKFDNFSRALKYIVKAINVGRMDALVYFSTYLRITFSDDSFSMRHRNLVKQAFCEIKLKKYRAFIDNFANLECH